MCCEMVHFFHHRSHFWHLWASLFGTSRSQGFSQIGKHCWESEPMYVMLYATIKQLSGCLTDIWDKTKSPGAYLRVLTGTGVDSGWGIVVNAERWSTFSTKDSSADSFELRFLLRFAPRGPRRGCKLLLSSARTLTCGIRRVPSMLFSTSISNISMILWPQK